MNRPSPEPASIGHRGLLGALLLALGLSWPWLGLLELWPMATDTGLWIQRGDPAAAGWLEWVFETRHFQVGYRPVTALSFSLGSLLGSPSPWLVRGTDCLVHVLGAVCLWGLLRRVLGQGRGAGFAALLGSALVLLHPAAQEVVPFSARRSYSLALLFSCAGLLVGVRVAGSGTRALGRSFLAGLLLVLALLSNEVASVAILCLPALRWLGDSSPRSPRRRFFSALQVSLLPALLVAVALYLRWRVVGGLGGYELEQGQQLRVASIWIASWRDLAGLGSLGSEGALWPLLWAGALLLGLGGASRALAVEGRRCSGLPLLAAVWLLAYGVLFAAQGVWYSRQAYACLPALGLGLACLARAAAVGRGRGRVLAGVAGLSTAGCLLLASPVWRGVTPERLAKWKQRQALIEHLLQAKDLEAPARVACVLPFRRPTDTQLKAKGAGSKLPRDARQPLLWARYLLRDTDVLLEEFLYVHEPDWSWANRLVPVLGGARPALRVPLDREIVNFRFNSPKLRRASAGELEYLPKVKGPTRQAITALFLYGAAGGEWLTLDPRAPSD